MKRSIVALSLLALWLGGGPSLSLAEEDQMVISIERLVTAASNLKNAAALAEGAAATSVKEQSKHFKSLSGAELRSEIHRLADKVGVLAPNAPHGALPDIFGYTKDARLAMTTNRKEPFEGHRQYVKDHPSRAQHAIADCLKGIETALQKVVADGSQISMKTPIVLGDQAAISLKKQSASVTGLMVLNLGNFRSAGKASKLSLTALRLESDGPASIAFNQPVGSDMETALKEVARLQAMRHGGWPRGQRMELSFADKYTPKDGPSAAVACALVLESLIAGADLDPDFAVTGDLNADGSVQPIGGVMAKIRGATKGGAHLIALPEKNRSSVLDLTLSEGVPPLIGIQIFSLVTFDDAVALARVDKPAALAQAIREYQVLNEKLKDDLPFGKTPECAAGLHRVLSLAPNHLSARMLLDLAEGKMPAHLTPGGSLDAVGAAVASVVEAAHADLSAAATVRPTEVIAARKQLQKLRFLVDPRVLLLVDAWIHWGSLFDQFQYHGRISPKLEADFDQAGEKIVAEERKLHGNTDFSEDLVK